MNENLSGKLEDFIVKGEVSADFKQYKHLGDCKSGPCFNPANDRDELCCKPFANNIHEIKKLHQLPKHFLCDCIYIDIPIKPVGSISNRQPAPDVWLKYFGKLPDYYITKKEAIENYGWEPGKDLSKLAPGKMIGGGVYKNDKHILPEKDGRVWKYCDIDYVSGKRRNSLRLFYSDDGLIFYSPDHLDAYVTVYQII